MKKSIYLLGILSGLICQSASADIAKPITNINEKIVPTAVLEQFNAQQQAFVNRSLRLENETKKEAIKPKPNKSKMYNYSCVELTTTVKSAMLSNTKLLKEYGSKSTSLVNQVNRNQNNWSLISSTLNDMCDKLRTELTR